MAKAKYMHDGPPPGIGFEAPPALSSIDAVDSEVPDLLSQFDQANSHRLYSGGSPGTSEPIYYSWPRPESRLLHRNYRDNPVL